MHLVIPGGKPSAHSEQLCANESAGTQLRTLPGALALDRLNPSFAKFAVNQVPLSTLPSHFVLLLQQQCLQFIPQGRIFFFARHLCFPSWWEFSLSNNWDHEVSKIRLVHPHSCSTGLSLSCWTWGEWHACKPLTLCKAQLFMEVLHLAPTTKAIPGLSRYHYRILLE